MGCVGPKNNKVKGAKSWASFESEEAMEDIQAKEASKSEINGQESNPPTERSKSVKLASPKPCLGRSNSPRTGSPKVGNPSHQNSTLIDPDVPTTYYNDSPKKIQSSSNKHSRNMTETVQTLSQKGN
jgi:hypothetical protein